MPFTRPLLKISGIHPSLPQRDGSLADAAGLAYFPSSGCLNDTGNQEWRGTFGPPRREKRTHYFWANDSTTN
jgi:hypothetical protein